MSSTPSLSVSLLLALILAAGAAPAKTPLPGKATMTDFSALERTIRDTWDFHDPATSEQRFVAMLDSVTGDRAAHAIVHTQVARAQGLQRQFDEAQATLDTVEQAVAALPPGRPQIHARARLDIERGRAFNSAGDPGRARPLFEEAFAEADSAMQPALAVDAAHMVAIAAANDSAAGDALAWNERALAMAESSSNPEARSWRASLLNNLGWTYHDAGDFPKALGLFERAVAARKEEGDARSVREARWMVARCLRSLGRLDDALAQQRALEKECALSGEPDGYVFEELGECLYALGKKDEAKPWFAKAHDELVQDPFLRYDEPQRLERLQELSGR
ncbi:MAG: tetratricopeptide repeat protein [Candidatus Eisenbacteria bacterium]